MQSISFLSIAILSVLLTSSSNADTCPQVNTDPSNPGRCGPLFGGVRCNQNLVSYAVYCNEANGWCGSTSSHQNAQASDIYDYQPSSCHIPCPPLNTDASNEGRCGPSFGGVRCNQELVSYAVYCNSDNGWCGTSSAHQNAQAEDKYDYNPSSCVIAAGPTAGGVDCCTKRCRKEWSTLSQTERNLYINGFKTLADQGVIQELSLTHSTSALHDSVYFLPWHRAFVEILEDAIRGLGGDYTCFGMPYWDWSNEPTPTEVSNGDTLVIMDSGIGDDSNGACQNSGSVFDENEYTPQSSSCLVRDVDYTTDFYCTFATPADVMQLVGSTSSYSVFDGGLEFGAGMHGYPHICIGGNMATYYSPDDPAFYLHHTYIDYIWALWQDCHDKEVGTTTSWSDAFWGSLTQSLSFSPYTADTYTPGDIMNIEDSNIIYEQGPLFSNVVVDASNNCPGTVNSNWFTDFGTRRRRLKENESRRRLSQGTGRKRPTQFRHRRSDGILQDLEVEMEECTNGRMACPVDNIDDFEDCTGLTDDEINALTVDDIKSMDGLNDCQIAAREGEYDFAKQNGYLRALCNGCMDPVCDQTILWDKCAVDNDNSGNSAQSVPGTVNNDHNPNYNKPENKPLAPFNEKHNGWNSAENTGTIQVRSSLLFIVAGLLVMNIICLTVYCWNNNSPSNERKGYKVVRYESEHSDV